MPTRYSSYSGTSTSVNISIFSLQLSRIMVCMYLAEVPLYVAVTYGVYRGLDPEFHFSRHSSSYYMHGSCTIPLLDNDANSRIQRHPNSQASKQPRHDKQGREGKKRKRKTDSSTYCVMMCAGRWSALTSVAGECRYLPKDRQNADVPTSRCGVTALPTCKLLSLCSFHRQTYLTSFPKLTSSLSTIAPATRPGLPPLDLLVHYPPPSQASCLTDQ